MRIGLWNRDVKSHRLGLCQVIFNCRKKTPVLGLCSVKNYSEAERSKLYTVRVIPDA